MSKFVSATLLATALLLVSARYSSHVVAGTCASRCGPRPIQFKPGQNIRIEVVNSTYNLVNLQKPDSTNPISLQSGQQLQFEQTDSTELNASLLFWNTAGLPLKANVSKPNFATLRVELRPTWYAPGDRAIYISDDGRVSVL